MIIFLLFFPLFVGAQVDVKWLSVASVLIDDGQSKILFDPAYTRPGFLHWLGLKKFTPDEALVSEIMKRQIPQDLDAIFVSHSHFDHIIDAPFIAKRTGARFYVDESQEKIAKAYKDPSIKTLRFIPAQKILIGRFTIRVFERSHDKIQGLFDFLPGAVKEDFNFNFWDYHLGKLWFYLIEHPDGVLLLDESSGAFFRPLPSDLTKIDVLLQGIGNRRSDEDLLSGYAAKFRPKIFMPLHFDNFFADLEQEAKKLNELPGVNKDRLIKKMQVAYPSLRILDPKFGETFRVLPTSYQ